jgi:DNA-binding LacI/PurR family transcriptional regulator
MKKTSIEDVAKSLGVSKTLVSLVINNKWKKFGISEQTRDRVMKKVEELNFKPNVAARGLRTGKSNIIALIVSDISNPFYSRIAHIIESLARNNSYQLMICSSDEDTDKELNLVKYFIDSHQADGIIISSSMDSSKVYKTVLPKDYPVVFIDRDLAINTASSVTVNNVKGAFEAVSLLIKNGSRHPAIFTISPSHISTIAERLEGYKNALNESNITVNKSYIREIPFDDIKNAVYNNLNELLNSQNNIDSLFVVNNNIAMACLEYFNEYNISIPGKLKFISFDDVNVFKFVNPSVTAVAQPIDEIAAVAYLKLASVINKENIEPVNKVLDTSLVIRKSCGS